MCSSPCLLGQSLCWIKFDMNWTCCLSFTFVIVDFLVDKPCRPQTPLLIYALYLTDNDHFLCLVAKAAWSNPNVNFPRWGRYGNTSQLIEHRARQNLTVLCSRFSSEILFYTYLLTIYIKFILTTYKIMVNLGALNWFDSFIKRLKKDLGLYQPCDL